MLQTLFQRGLSLGVWGSLCVVFGFFIASGAPALSGAILAGMLLLVAILIGPQFIAAFWLLGAPTVFGFPNQILRVLPFVTMERMLLLILAVMVFLKIAFSKVKQPPLSFLEVLIIAFLSYALISLALHTTPAKVNIDGWFFIQYALPMTAFMVSRRIQWSEQGLKMLLASISVVGVVLAIIGALQLFFGVTVFSMNYQIMAQGHLNRAYGTFSNSHTYIATLFIFLMLTLMQLSLYRDAFIRFLLISAIFIMLLGILFGQSRAPWGGCIIALFIIFLRDRDVRSLLVTGGTIAVIGGLLVFLLKMGDLGSFVSRVTDMETLAGRLTTWATAINMIAHNPLFGVGFGADSYIMHRREYLTGIGSLPAQYGLHLRVPHNEYLHVAAQLGTLGLAMFLAILYKLAGLLFGIHKEEGASLIRRKLGLYMGAVVIGLLFNSLFSDTYLQDYFWAVTYFFAGLVAGMHSNLEQPHSCAVNEGWKQ